MFSFRSLILLNVWLKVCFKLHNSWKIMRGCGTSKYTSHHGVNYKKLLVTKFWLLYSHNTINVYSLMNRLSARRMIYLESCSKFQCLISLVKISISFTAMFLSRLALVQRASEHPWQFLYLASAVHLMLCSN